MTVESEATAAPHRAQVGVECPQCHLRQFVGVESELVETLRDSQVARQIHAELQAWMATHCPEHLNVISRMSKN
jgi:hypothetical protein